MEVRTKLNSVDRRGIEHVTVLGLVRFVTVGTITWLPFVPEGSGDKPVISALFARKSLRLPIEVKKQNI